MRPVNLSEYSFTFPVDVLMPEIPLDSKIREIMGRFSASTPCIILHGPHGSGKTIHLTQFIKSMPGNCFSHFVTDNIWNKRPSAFLSSLCRQMKVVLGQSDEADNIDIDLERLQSIFVNLTHKVAEVARKERTTFYFVIDGLDFACQGTPGERIIDLFPLPTSGKGLFLFGSIRDTSSGQIGFPHEIENPHYFSRLE